MKVSALVIPDVVFHGTNFDFDVFDSKRLGVSCNNPTTAFGHFFSDNKAEAISWAFRASDRRIFPKNPILVTADIAGARLFDMTPLKFAYYLKVARLDTIQRHNGKWREEGFDGFRVKLQDVEWFCVFDPQKIRVLERAPHVGGPVERVSEMLRPSEPVKPEIVVRIPRIIFDEPSI